MPDASQQERSPGGRNVPIERVMRNSSESRGLTGADQLPHPQATYAQLLLPTLLHAKASGIHVDIRGSMVRHAAMSEVSARDKTHIAPNRYDTDAFLRFTVLPWLHANQELSFLTQEQRATFNQLLEEPDMDILLGQDHRGPFSRTSRNEQFLADIPRKFLPQLCEAIAASDFRPNAQSLGYMDVIRAAEGKRTSKRQFDPSNHIHPVPLPQEDSSYTFAALVDVDVLPIPTSPEQWYPYTQRSPFPDSDSLLVYSQIIHPRPGVTVTRVAFAADQEREKVSGTIAIDQRKKLPFMTIDIIDIWGDPSEVDTRRVTTFDNQIATLQMPHIISSASTPHAELHLSDESLQAYREPVGLRPEWRKKSPANALEIATRALWQATDTEVNDPGRAEYITDATLEEIHTVLYEFAHPTLSADQLAQATAGNESPMSSLAQGLEASNKTDVWSQVPPTIRNLIQRNMLLTMITSPYRFIEYYGKSGIWDILMARFGTNAPNWQDCLERMNEMSKTATGTLLPKDAYAAMIQGEDAGDGMRRSGNFGWQMVDRAINLSDLTQGAHAAEPQRSGIDPLYLSRIFDFTLI